MRRRRDVSIVVSFDVVVGGLRKKRYVDINVVVIDIIVGGGLRRRRDVVPGNYKGIRIFCFTAA